MRKKIYTMLKVISLLKNNITLTEEFEGYKNRFDFVKVKCNIDNYHWDVSINSLAKGNCNCPKCNKMERLTNEIVDSRIIGRNIIRLDDVKTSAISIKWQCEIDGHIWSASPNTILANHGCPKCGGTERYSIEFVNNKLMEKNIKLISGFKNSDDIVDFECMIDGHKWRTSLRHVVQKTKCPMCANNARYTDEIIDNICEEKGFIRISSMKDNKKVMDFCCGKNQTHVWSTAPRLMRKYKGCPFCTRRMLNNEILDEDLRSKNSRIIRIGDYEGMDNKILFKCVEDDHEWLSMPNSILAGGGCPLCKFKGERELNAHIINVFDVIPKKNKRVTYEGKNYFIDYYLIYNGREIFIEYNGIQHYQPIEFFGGVTQFKKQEIRDEVIRKYSKMCDITLIEIPYWMTDEEKIKEMSKFS